MSNTLAGVVDLSRYPIDDLEGEGLEIVQLCQRSLRVSALCCLPGFLLPETLAAIRDEVAEVEHSALWIDSQRTPWSWRDHGMLPDDHPARVRSAHRLGSITRDQFDEQRTLLSLFKCDALTEFVRRVLGLEHLYRVECPYLSMNVKVMPEGSQHGWHFDQNDGAVSLLLQRARAGGHYEYVPYIRSDDDENYQAIADIIEGSGKQPQRVDIESGSLCIFNGRRSLHRVSPVIQGNPHRLIALFSYDKSPGMVYNQYTLQTVLGTPPRVESHS